MGFKTWLMRKLFAPPLPKVTLSFKPKGEPGFLFIPGHVPWDPDLTAAARPRIEQQVDSLPLALSLRGVHPDLPTQVEEDPLPARPYSSPSYDSAPASDWSSSGSDSGSGSGEP